MRIVHFSDWHGKMKELPEADIYVCTGDMLPNFPERQELRYNQVVYRIVRSVEEVKQREWIKDNKELLRSKMKSSDAPIVCVRGNHEFVNLGNYFIGEVYEIKRPTDYFEVKGIRFGGMRGWVMRPYDGISNIWGDELTPEGFENEARLLHEDIDVLLTHVPPNGILDRTGRYSIGEDSLNRYINLKHYYYNKPLELHCFGHVHESFGMNYTDDTVFSNAATVFNVIDL